MKILNKTQEFILSLDENKFKKYSYIIISVFLLLFGYFIYRYYSTTRFLKKELQQINRYREEAQVLLSKDFQIRQQKEKVDQILEKERGFKILQYFDSVTSKLGLNNNVKERTVSTNELENLRTEGYMEVSLDANFENINTKQVAELLNEIEKNERVYTKNLEIEKSTPQAINLKLTIATLQKAEEVEITE